MSAPATFTIEEYERMIARGVFAGRNEKSIELIRGELRMMSPQGAANAELLAQLDDWSHDVTDRRKVRVRVQSSIEIPQLDTQPEPDLVWTEARSFSHRRPVAHEVLLLAEVADSSLDYDLGEKRQLYAEAGIRDYWVFDIPNRSVHVFRDPSPADFQMRQTISAGDRVAPLLVDGVSLAVGNLFACLDR